MKCRIEVSDKDGIVNRRSFLKRIGVAAVGLSCSAVYPAGKAKASKPNVLFMAIDDMNDWTTLFMQTAAKSFTTTPMTPGNGQIWRENTGIKKSSNGTGSIYPWRDDEGACIIIRRLNESDRRRKYTTKILQ